MSFDIRSGVPIPRRGGRPGVFYPFEELQVGQCFVLPKTLQSNAWKKARAFMDAHPGWQFKGGMMPGEADKWGCWCVARPGKDDAPARLSTPLTRFAEQQPAESPMAQRLREAAKLTKAGVARTVTHK